MNQPFHHVGKQQTDPGDVRFQAHDKHGLPVIVSLRNKVEKLLEKIFVETLEIIIKKITIFQQKRKYFV
jgi:hypothetical protein